MVASTFPAALKALLKDEGGNDDDPDDHGGRTSRGVTQREYDSWRRLSGYGTQDVWSATDAEIEAIYHDHYWEPWCDKLPVGIDYLYFDLAVNAGPYRATKLLQRAIGVADDGIFGPITLEAAMRANPKLLIANYSEAKRKFYRSLNQKKYIRGWLNRVDHVETVANSFLTQGNA